jgi:hypothetical protein
MRKILCYDLVKAYPNDYKALIEYITDTLHGVQATESVWVFFSEEKNNTILKNRFRKFMDSNDKLLVADLPIGVSCVNLKDTDKWIKK